MKLECFWQQIVRTCSIRVPSLTANSLPQNSDSIDPLLILIKMVNRSELRNSLKLLIIVFFFLCYLIFRSNQKGKKKADYLYYLRSVWWKNWKVTHDIPQKFMEKKSLAQLSETSLNDPRLHHEVTLVVIDSHPNSPWKHYASLNKKINT